MNNNRKIDKSKLFSVLNAAAAGTEIKPDKISAALEKGDTDALLKSLPEEGAKQLQALLNDKAALQSILNSPQAAKLFKDLTN